MSQTIKIKGMSNREFLESYARPGRIGLAGGSTSIDKAIGRAQRHLDADKAWSQWSHAFVFQGQRVDGQHWVIESDLQINRKHIRLGVQENRISKFFDDGYYTHLTVLDFDLAPEQVGRVLAEGLELVANRVKYSVRELFGTLIALRYAKLRTRDNLLDRDKSFYCSAFVHHLFRTAQIDLAPGLTVKNTTPEDIWRTAVPHTCYVLDRPVPQGKLRKLRQRVKKRLPKRRTK
ncbi:MAG: hypothetical protein K8T91_08325 [Planctomycetes bacterium]|nr:hypothetical protein [Planctomycetota bacterium]